MFAIRVFCLSLCPPQEWLIDCHCQMKNNFRMISCGGHNTIDLYDIFNKLSYKIPPSAKSFDIFHLNNTAIKIISANVFNNITFKTVFFDGTIQLEYIDPNAFIGTENQVMNLVLNINC